MSMAVSLKEGGRTDKGVASIKPEFLLADHVPTLVPDYISTTDKLHLQDSNVLLTENGEQPIKKLKHAKKITLKGLNKNRGPTFRQDKRSQLCPQLINNASPEAMPICNNDRCTFMHDTSSYMASKPNDIGDTCYVFNTHGFCPRGLTCRFGKSHITDDGRNITKCFTTNESNCNYLSKDLQQMLRKRVYSFDKSEDIVNVFNRRNKSNQNVAEKLSGDNTSTELGNGSVKMLGPVEECDIIRLRHREKPTIRWNGKLVLSPLTTVGNLPFRRICKEFGADVTCGEMALASSLLQGKAEEWALVRRHDTENIFGVQICGNNAHVMTKCAQLLQENTSIDFLDVNLGCPIDLVYKQGAGSGLLRRERVLLNTLSSISHVLDMPLTVKTRTGVYKDQNVAHMLVPRFVDCGVSLISIHGRTREQRYTKSADWNYIEECARLTGDVPVFGNGDILSFTDYNEKLETCPHVKGVLLARGALYKPWLFTEIKEQRHWDISSVERMDIIKKYVNYGLEHWGTDNKGVENTRRFLLEWLSFLHRYIPVGLLERLPQKINERPPVYKGRDELETLFASSNCKDWIKISEMLLGPVPEGFRFLPKHKANSWK